MTCNDELTSFLDCYAHPAAIFDSSNAILYSNAPFASLTASFDDRVVPQLVAAIDLGHTHTQTTLGDDEPVRWSLTRQSRPGDHVRIIALAHNTIPLPSRDVSNEKNEMDFSWIGQPKWKAISEGGGVMGDYLRALDWSQTPLGPVRSWSSTLIAMVGLLLASPHPMTLL
jgi:hypothetical protein